MTRLRVTDRSTGLVAFEGEVGERDGSSPAHHVDVISRSNGRGPTTRGRIVVETVADGWRFEFEVEDADLAALRERATHLSGGAGEHGPTEVRAIIPGQVVSIAVEVGAEVGPGQRLLAVEAMKMENELRAPRGGVVDRLVVTVGQNVEAGDVLVVLR
jgi:biotin carboxyl carrier protein